jgi:hypothetical protein
MASEDPIAPPTIDLTTIGAGRYLYPDGPLAVETWR